jgi:hypothetical protein
MPNVIFTDRQSAIAALQAMGFTTVADVIAAGFRLREVRPCIAAK